jgi:hypothetical protein
MLAFRSEVHVDRWREQRCLPLGAVFSLDQMWGLADAWYRNRLDREWRRRTPEEIQALFSELALEGEFWRVT